MNCGVMFLFVILVILNGCSSQQQEPLVPAFFIFGDSIVDNGNNNAMVTLSRANYRPYGIDFNQGTTGRFTNGRTLVDVMAQLLGFPNYIPPYARTRGRYLLRGVNFASGAAGIRDETGNNLGAHISMNQQVQNFGRVAAEINRYFRGDQSAKNDYLSKCIFYCGLGNNDYLNNYYMPAFYTTSSRFTPKAFAESLLQDYTRQLTGLYNFGARKVIVSSVGRVGCIPFHLARYNGTGSAKCNEEINSGIQIFNDALKSTLDRFNNGQLPSSKFLFLDNFQTGEDLAVNSVSYGLTVIDKGCCGVGRNNGQITCLPLEQPCEDRTKYLFWDAFHPTEAANLIVAKKAFTSTSRSYIHPMNIQELINS